MSLAFGDKVELASENDLLKIQQLMEQAVEQAVQRNAQGNNEEFRQALKTMSANALGQMQLFMTSSDANNGLTPNHPLKSPILKPLSPPPVDAEVKALEAEVEEASKRVAAMRENMQTVLQDRLTAKLAQCRPSAEVTPPQPPTAGEEPVDDSLSPAAQELQQRLGDTAARLPELRARLEEATERLNRVVTAVTEEMARGAPNTVERVMIGAKTPGGEVGVIADKEQEDGNDGVVEPVPCPLNADTTEEINAEAVVN